MKLRAGLLYLIVYGPGYGESVILRDPAGTWIVIDGCVVDGRSPAAELLREHQAAWSCVILTHPHLDHAIGLDGVLELPGSGPIGCTAPAVRPPQAWLTSADAERHLREGTVGHVLATIHDRWTSRSGCRWEMRRGDERRWGELTLTVLHPDESTIATRPSNPNRLSSGLLADWRGLRLLLGADVIAEDWEGVAASVGRLASHRALKFPHHGAAGAVHASWGAGTKDRLWVVTPYNRGHKLPRFDDGHGVAWALECVEKVHLTGLPVRHDLQGKVPYVTTRQALRDGRNPAPEGQHLPGGLRFSLQADLSGTWDACVVAAGFDERGALVDLQHGPGALVVREEASAT